MQIELKGASEILKKLGLVGTLQTLEPAMHKALYRLQADIATYPPAPLGSSYRRTGTLGRRWLTKVETLPDRLTGTIGNNTTYAPLVQSERFQRPAFKRIGWPTDQGVLDRNEDAIVEDFQQAVDEALK